MSPTRKFLEVLGFATLRDLPDLQRLKADDLLQGGQGKTNLDGALGLADGGSGYVGRQQRSLTLPRLGSKVEFILPSNQWFELSVKT
jgi:hypothetical protein